MNKVAVIIPSNFDNSGVPKVCIDLYNALGESYEFVFVVKDKDNDYYSNYVKEKGSRVYYLGESKRKYLRYVYRLLVRNFKIYQIIKNEKINILYTCSGYEAGFECYLASKLGVSKRIIHSHGIFIDRKGFNLIVRIYQKLGRILLERYSTKRVSVSAEAGRSLFCKKPFTVINNSVDIEKYRNVVHESHSGLELVQIGYFNANKNQLFTLTVLDELVRQGLNVKLTFIGYPMDKNYFDIMKQFISNNFLNDYVEFLPHDVEKEQVLGKFDFALLPSLHEGLSLVALECQATSVKVITSTGVPDCVNVGMMRKINLTDKQKWIDCILENMNTQWALDTKKLSNYSFENFKKSMQLVFDGESK